MLNFAKNKKTKSELNLVSLIDIIFVTLIFFLILYRFSTFTQASESEYNFDNLNAFSMSKTFNKSDTVIIEIDEDGNILANGYQLSEITSEEFTKFIPNADGLNYIMVVDNLSPNEFYGKVINILKDIGAGKVCLIK